jgi:DNA-directed RNA polymerase subunit RPC12/RpoP
MTATAYNFARTAIPCLRPECGKIRLYLVRDLVYNDHIKCEACGHRIDVSSEKWRAAADELANFYKNVRV